MINTSIVFCTFIGCLYWFSSMGKLTSVEKRSRMDAIFVVIVQSSRACLQPRKKSRDHLLL